MSAAYRFSVLKFTFLYFYLIQKLHNLLQQNIIFVKLKYVRGTFWFKQVSLERCFSVAE